MADTLDTLLALLPRAGEGVLGQLGLAGQAVLFALTLARVAGAVMLMPAIGEEAVPARVRMLAALALTLVIMPHATGVPATHGNLLIGVVGESLLGIGYGLLIRLAYAAAVVAGSYIATAVGIAGAVFFDPAAGGETTAVTRVIVMACVVLLLSLDVHHVYLRGLAMTYAGHWSLADTASLARAAVEAMSFMAEVALRMAAPFIAYGLLFNLALGLVSRLTPQIQLYFIAQPANMLLALALLAGVAGTSCLFFARALGERALAILS